MKISNPRFSGDRLEYFCPSWCLIGEDTPLDTTPTWGDNPKIGVVIGTYGFSNVIEEQLIWLKKNGCENILIHDDHSSEKKQLEELCKKYGADFYYCKEKLFYCENIGSNGDLSAFNIGLLWAKQKGLDILIKLSRRLIPRCIWLDRFKELAVKVKVPTYSSYCEKDNMQIRTECMAMSVEAWSNPNILYWMFFHITKDFPIFAEFWFDFIAKKLQFYCKNSTGSKDYRTSGYCLWTDLLGTNRYSREGRLPGVDWHMFNDFKETTNGTN